MVQNGWRSNRREELEGIAAALEQLALEIREEAAQEPGPETHDGDGVPMPMDVPVLVPAQPQRSAAAEGLRKGLRVRVTVPDRYRGRVGTLVDPRGSHFWNILLDPVDGGVALLIYKKTTSFVAVDND